MFDDLKRIFGSDEVMLELVQLEDGAMALRIANTEDAPLVRIEFHEEICKLLGEDLSVVGQGMIHAAVFGVMEQQAKRWRSQVAEASPEIYS
ncbi:MULTISPECIES: hypothetical protein [unclassified Acinetobacter]|uniref:hypothetical protein n=1 Tax=unclassified Acinetobacter TaxID=196816 RepID=UPI0035BA218A